MAWLAKIFGEVWIPDAVVKELDRGRQAGADAPDPRLLAWAHVVESQAVPSAWLALDLGPGEIGAMSLALENPTRVVFLDDARARRVAQAAGLDVWGTLRVLLEAKSLGIVPRIAPSIDRLSESGMWISRGVRSRILALAGEDDPT